MIFVCVGSREYQFNRLLKKIDELLQENKITESIFAQIGSSDYIPNNYEYKRFLSHDEFDDYQKKANIIITHGGTGSIINSLKLEKQVIVVPRLAKYKEHIDDHQLQVTQVLEREGYIKSVIDINELEIAIEMVKLNPIRKIFKKDSNIINIIEEFIND